MISILFIYLTLLSGSQSSENRPTVTTQTTSTWYSRLPRQDQEQFLKTYDSFIDLRKRRDWKRLFELFQNEENLSESEFERIMNSLHPLMDFRPKAMFYVPPSEEWIITGEASFRKNEGSEYWAPSRMHAKKVHSRWRFSDIAIDVVGGK